MPTTTSFSTFARNERGSVAILFGVCALMLVFVIGVAVDQARVYQSQSRIAAAADAAALAAGRALMDGAMSDEEIAALGRRFFNENLASGGTFADIGSVTVTPDRANSTIRVNVDADVPMTFTRVAGYQTVATDQNSLTTFRAQDLELAMALDITGSMLQDNKLDDLKLAAKTLVNVLLPDRERPNKVRIGLAPYSASIQLGPYADLASDGTSRDGCVRERTGASAYKDDSIRNGGAYRGNGRFRDIDRTEGLQSYVCPSAEIVPLTDKKQVLTDSIDSYRANGATAGHIGLQWAWNLVSPNFDDLWPTDSDPVAYSDKKTIKAVVLMTDGVFNMAYDNGNSSAQALSTCAELGSAGVVVHTVVFETSTPIPSAKAMLEECATRAGGTYHEAKNGVELEQAFIEIAESLNDLRLTQ